MPVETETATTTYRLLHPDEWPRVAPVFEARGVQAPNPALAMIAVAERDGEIVGFLTLQPMIHAEPLYVAEGHTADVYIPRLLHLLEDAIKGVFAANGGGAADLYVFSDKPTVGRLAKAHGFEHAPYHVWRKHVGVQGGE